MSRKTMILLGMVIGSLTGSYVAGSLGAASLSLTSLLGSGVGSVAGVWLAFKLTA